MSNFADNTREYENWADDLEAGVSARRW